MTATFILEHSIRTKQSLIELSASAREISKQIQFLHEQISSQLSKLVIELDKEIDNPKKFIRFYDLEKFHQWNESHLNKFNNTIFKLSLEARNYQKMLHTFQMDLHQIKLELAHTSTKEC